MLASISRLLCCVAISTCLAVAGCSPTGTDSLTQRATREYEKGDLERAQGDLQRALAFEPSDPQALLCMGKIYHAQNKLEMAAFYYQSAIGAEPSNKEARACLLQVQEELGPSFQTLQIVPLPEESQPRTDVRR